MSRHGSFAMVVAALGLAACGGFGSSDSTPPTETPDGGGSTPDSGLDPVGGEAARGITLTAGKSGETLFVLQGKTATAAVTLLRRSASVGPVAVTVKNLPAGVTADALTIPTGASDGKLTLHATSMAPQGLSTLDVSAVEQVTNGASATAKLDTFVRGLPGTLDTTFGTGGVVKEVFTVTGSAVSDARVLKTGAIIVAGRRVNNLSILRYTQNGAVDVAFAGGGNVNLAASQGNLFLDVVEGKTAADSFISATGGFGTTVPLSRLTLDGALVTSFATTGTANVTLGLGVGNGTQSIVLPDGRVLLLTVHIGATKVAVVSRWKVNGTLDDSYGLNGLCQLTASGTGSTVAPSVTMLPRVDGSVHVAMNTADGQGFVKGCTATGLLDTTLGATADHFVSTAPHVAASRSADGGVVLLGSTGWERANALLVRDTTIGSNGSVALAQLQLATSLLTLQDGGVVIGGMGTNAGAFTLVRYKANGTLDTAFGTAGVATIEVTATNTAEVAKLVAQPDGRILVVGTQFETADGVLARVWP